MGGSGVRNPVKQLTTERLAVVLDALGCTRVCLFQPRTALHYTPLSLFIIMWWCYRASVCAIGITSLSLSDSYNISFILSHCNHQITNHQPTDTLSRNLHSQRTDVPRWLDGTTRRPCTRLCSPLYTRSICPTSQTGGLPWMPTLTRPATFQTGATPVWRMEESSRHNYYFPL